MQILQAVAKNQPDFSPLPNTFKETQIETESLQLFRQVLSEIGGQTVLIPDIGALAGSIGSLFPGVMRKVSTIPALAHIAEICATDQLPHELENVGLAILEGVFGVAENGSVWLTETQMGLRILPFICQHLVLVIRKNQILDNMHLAYARIADTDYGFGTFIAGPSKTADIEQSLVLGAHGPKSLTVLILS